MKVKDDLIMFKSDPEMFEKEKDGETFVRKLTDITLLTDISFYGGVYIFSWSMKELGI